MSLLDLIFPKYCLGCGQSDSYFCDDCLVSFFEYQKQCCPNCRRYNKNGDFCGRQCSQNFNFDRLIVCAEYKFNSPIKKLIVSLKYKFIKEISDSLAKIMSAQLAFHSHEFLGEKVFVVAVPSSHARMRMRNFNQAELLAKNICKNFGNFEFLDCLRRISQGATQASSGREERIHNLRGKIKCDSDICEKIRGSTILLIDDVATTCATLNECAGELKKQGAKKVCGLVLARALLSGG